MLAVVAFEDLELHQMDVKTSFLSGDLSEDIYMGQSEALVEQGKLAHVCMLQKTLYGLKRLQNNTFLKFTHFCVKNFTS